MGRAGAALQRSGPAAAASASTEAAQARRYEAAGISSFGSARSHQFLRVGDPVSVYLLRHGSASGPQRTCYMCMCMLCACYVCAIYELTALQCV